jgi:tetratricopeptide (TPR) repeat protein
MLLKIRAFVAAGALLGLFLLTGCATPQVQALLAQPPEGLPTHAELVTVPFFPQEEYQCGPAALATVLKHAGVAISPEGLVQMVYLPAREGSLQVEMLAAARSHGQLAYRLAPRLQDLLAEVAAGNPVIVLQNLSLAFAPVWHYAVVIGYDLGREEIILRSGTTHRLSMTLTTFEHTWARGRHWAMIALPPHLLPETAAEAEYVAASAALERVSPLSARYAYAAALKRWPMNLTARLGFGNVAYSQGDLALSEESYRRATVDHPGSGDAWNNLAQVLFEMGRKDDALIAARKAVALGGPRIASYRMTLDSIISLP